METRTRRMKLSDCCPVAGIRDGVILSRDGAVTIGWELTLPAEDSVTQEGYELMAATFASALRSLPEWTVVHRQDRYVRREYSSEEGSSFLSRSYAEHFGGRPFLEARHYLFLSVNPLLPGRSGMFRRFSSTCAFGMRRHPVAADTVSGAADALLSKGSDFVSVVSSCGICARRLGTRDLEGAGTDGGILQSWLGLGSGGPLSGDIWRDERGSVVETSGKRLMAWSLSRVDDLPGEVEESICAEGFSSQGHALRRSWMSPLGTGLSCEHAVNTYWVRPPQQEVLQMLERRKKNMTAFSDRDAENTVNAQDLEEFIGTLHRDSTTCVWTHADVMAWDVPEREGEVRGEVSAALSRMGTGAKMNTYDTPVLFWAALPGGEMELGEDAWRLAELRESLCFTTWESFQQGLPGGFLRLCDRHRRIPIPFDTLDAAYSRRLIENYNAFILGPSGSGKSFFTNWYVRSCYDRGGHVFIIDKGDSYEAQCALVREESGGRDGIYCTWSAEHPFSFNPFAGWRDWDADEDGEGMEFLLCVLRMLWTPKDGWNEVNGPILESIVRDFLRSVSGQDSDPVFDDFYRFLGGEVMPRILRTDRRRKAYTVGHGPVTAEDFDIADMDKALSPFAGGGRYAFLLNDPSPADLLDSRFVVFEVEGLSEQKAIYPVCTFCILDAFRRRMRRDSQEFKLMFIDEAWAAIDSPQTAAYIKSLWKTARKYHTQAAVVTQQLSDITSSPVVQDAVLGNSPVKILLDQRSNAAAFDEMARCFGLSERDAALVQSVGRNPDPRCSHEVFITLGGRLSGVFGMEVSPQERLAYESDKKEKRPLLDLARRTGSMMEAIDRMSHGKDS